MFEIVNLDIGLGIKGADVSTVEIESDDFDEIQRFVNARTIDPHDAV